MNFPQRGMLYFEHVTFSMLTSVAFFVPCLSFSYFTVSGEKSLFSLFSMFFVASSLRLEPSQVPREQNLDTKGRTLCM